MGKNRDVPPPAAGAIRDVHGERRREVAGIAPLPRRGAPFVARRAVNLHGCA